MRFYLPRLVALLELSGASLAGVGASVEYFTLLEELLVEGRDALQNAATLARRVLLLLHQHPVLEADEATCDPVLTLAL